MASYMSISLLATTWFISWSSLFNSVSSFELRGKEPVATTNSDYPPELLISTTQGNIQGVYNELGVRQWKGIPYAKPPVNELRCSPILFVLSTHLTYSYIYIYICVCVCM